MGEVKPLKCKDGHEHQFEAGDFVGVANGGTGADLSVTGGAGQYVKQASAGAALSVGAIAAGDLPTGIDAAKLADGSVSNAEFQRLDGVTAGIQGQLDGKQPLDATLTSLAGLGTAADRVAYTTGVDTWAETPLTAAGRALLDDASAADQRTTLGAAATSHTHETDDLTRLGWSMSDTGGYSLATATTYDYTFTAAEEDFDTNSFHADGGSTCTVPTGGAGLYLIHGWSYVTALAAGAVFDVDIAINDVTYKSGIYRWQGVGNASINQCSGVSAIVALADGDTVELRLWHNHGSNRTVYGSLSGVRLCA